MSTSERTPLLINNSQPNTSKGDKATCSRGVARDGEGSSLVTETTPETPVAGIWLYISIFSCVIGTSFSFGYSLGCVNTPALVIVKVFGDWYYKVHHLPIPLSQSTFLWTATVSFYCLGGMVGGCFAGLIADSFGRKRSMMVGNILQIWATLLMFFSMWIQRYEVIIIARVIYGVYGGFATVVCPLYLNEISPPAIKGRVGIVNQLTIVIALTLSQILGLPQLLGTEDRFYYLLALPLAPAVIHWVVLAMCPESPSWLYLFKKDKDGAKKALEKLRNMNLMSSVNSELSEYEKQETAAATQPKVTLSDMFYTYRITPLMIACFMQCSQQLSGINAVIFYSTTIFVHANLSHDNAQYATLSLGAVMIIMTLVCIATIERVGRRTLHLCGLAGCAISLVLLTFFLVLGEQENLQWTSYLCIVSVAIFIISFNSGPGSIPWFYPTEIFEPASYKWGMSIAIAVNWLCNFIVGITFPYMLEGLGNYVFLPFLGVTVLLLVLLYYRLPETKGNNVRRLTEFFKDWYNSPDIPSRRALIFFHHVQS